MLWLFLFFQLPAEIQMIFSQSVFLIPQVSGLYIHLLDSPQSKERGYNQVDRVKERPADFQQLADSYTYTENTRAPFRFSNRLKSPDYHHPRKEKWLRSQLLPTSAAFSHSIPSSGFQIHPSSHTRPFASATWLHKNTFLHHIY